MPGDYVNAAGHGRRRGAVCHWGQGQLHSSTALRHMGRRWGWGWSWLSGAEEALLRWVACPGARLVPLWWRLGCSPGALQWWGCTWGTWEGPGTVLMRGPRMLHLMKSGAMSGTCPRQKGVLV